MEEWARSVYGPWISRMTKDEDHSVLVISTVPAPVDVPAGVPVSEPADEPQDISEALPGATETPVEGGGTWMNSTMLAIIIGAVAVLVIVACIIKKRGVKTVKQSASMLLALVLMSALAIPVLAADYEFESGSETWGGFGKATSYDGSVKTDTLSANERRNKDAAVSPPPFGVFSGEIPTDPTSPYHNNLPTGGFVPVDQGLPPVGNEGYAPGDSTVDTGLLPSTSQANTMNTLPWPYDDGTIGTLTIHKLNKTIKVYEGESLENMRKGIGHFVSTSAWDGNVGLAGHNRGAAAYFGFVKDLANGDRITYATRYGTRAYEVFAKERISETDFSPLYWTSENILTLITCVENVPGLRWCVQAREIR